MENSPGLGNLQLNSEREDSNLLHFGLFQLGVPWEISEDDPGPPELLEPLDTKSTGFHPKNPLFFFSDGWGKTGSTWRGQRGPEEFQRVGWG